MLWSDFNVSLLVLNLLTAILVAIGYSAHFGVAGLSTLSSGKVLGTQDRFVFAHNRRPPQCESIC
jgi:hypothetical protein